MSKESTNARLRWTTLERLKKLGISGESIETIVSRLLDEREEKRKQK